AAAGAVGGDQLGEPDLAGGAAVLDPAGGQRDGADQAGGAEQLGALVGGEVAVCLALDQQDLAALEGDQVGAALGPGGAHDQVPVGFQGGRGVVLKAAAALVVGVRHPGPPAAVRAARST